MSYIDSNGIGDAITWAMEQRALRASSPKISHDELCKLNELPVGFHIYLSNCSLSLGIGVGPGRVLVNWYDKHGSALSGVLDVVWFYTVAKHSEPSWPLWVALKDSPSAVGTERTYNQLLAAVGSYYLGRY